MLTSQLGIRVVLLLGDTVPLPAPYAVSNALARVEVTNDVSGGDGFQLTFSIAKDSPAEYGLVREPRLAPFTRVVIGVVLGVSPEVLIDGIITHHQVAPSNEPGKSTLTVTGRDISVMMDLEEKNAKYENQPDFVIVNTVLASYARYGLLPPYDVTPTTDVHISLMRITRQYETDLAFVQRLAQNHGFVFYVEPVTFGVSSAHWGPENRLSVPQPALTMNMGAATNVSSLQFQQDAMAPVGTKASFLEPITKTSIPVPSLPSLRIPPLVPLPTAPRRTRLLRDNAQRNAAEAAMSVIAEVTNAADSVTGDGELDTIAYGHVLRARRLVGVRGAGFSYDGLYYTKRVTHEISRGEYKQRFSIAREGTGALLPVVRP
jgi:hypothetical protein